MEWGKIDIKKEVSGEPVFTSIHPLLSWLECYSNITVRNRILPFLLHDRDFCDFWVNVSFTGTLGRRRDVRLLLPFSLHLLHCLQEGGRGGGWSCGGGVWIFLRRMSSHIMSSLGGPLSEKKTVFVWNVHASSTTWQHKRLHHKRCRNGWCHCSALCVCFYVCDV